MTAPDCHCIQMATAVNESFALFHKNLFKTCLFRRFITASLQGRDICHPSNFTNSDVKKILWTAFDLKRRQCINDFLKGRHLTFLLGKASFRHQASFNRAAHALGAEVTFVLDEELCQLSHAKTTGKSLGSMSDAVIVSGLDQRAVHEVADGADVPVISCSSDAFCIAESLAHFMTMMEHLGPLRRRCLAWVGPLNASSLSFLYLAPKLNLNYRACIIDRLPVDSSTDMSEKLLHWEKGISENRGQADFHECSSLEEAVFRADVIATSSHQKSDFGITSRALEEAALDWYFMHSLPRTSTEVSDDVFQHKNNLTWESLANSRYIAMALMAEVLKEYEPTSPMPDFEGEP